MSSTASNEVTTPVITFPTGATGSQNYMASTVENILIGRDSVTSIAPIPGYVFDILWKMDINTALNAVNIKSPTVIDSLEQVIKKDSTFYYYKLSTNNSPAVEIAVTCTGTYPNFTAMSTVNNGVTRSVTGLTTENECLLALAKRLSTDGTTVTSLLSDGSQDVHSSLSPSYVDTTSTGILNSLSDNTQTTPLLNFMTNLKGVSGSWYFANENNPKSIQTQVKEGLAQLFDKDPQLNNLIGSSTNSTVFIDSSLIASKMKNGSDANNMYTHFFSDKQLREVLSAVADKGNRITKGAAGVNTFNFQVGDTISAMVKVTDTDSTTLNMDRWLITLQHTV